MREEVVTVVFELDGSRISNLDGFYAEISRVLIPGAEWGHNLDAFNDILKGGFGTPEGGFTLVWNQSERSRCNLGHGETARVLEKRLSRCHPTARASVAKRLAAAHKGEGPTVFDTLLEIIRGHTHITLVLK